MVTVKNVIEQNRELDCVVVIQSDDWSFEDSAFGWSGPLSGVPDFLYGLPVKSISQSLKALEHGYLKFYLYVPLDKIKAAFTELDLPFSEEVPE